MFATTSMPIMTYKRFDDAGFQARTKLEFPEKCIANAEEARVLWDLEVLPAHRGLLFRSWYRAPTCFCLLAGKHS